MYSRFFSSSPAEDSRLLALTKKGFYSLVSSQTEIFHAVVVCRALKNLNVEDENFNEEYNQIIFGGMVYESAIEADKYCLNDLYPLMCHELRKLCGVAALNCDSNKELEEQGGVLIKLLGEKILTGKLEFSLEHLNQYFKRSEKYVKNHLPGSCPNRSQHYIDFISFKTVLTQRYAQMMQDITSGYIATPLQKSYEEGMTGFTPTTIGLS